MCKNKKVIFVYPGFISVTLGLLGLSAALLKKNLNVNAKKNDNLCSDIPVYLHKHLNYVKDIFLSVTKSTKNNFYDFFRHFQQLFQWNYTLYYKCKNSNHTL